MKILAQIDESINVNRLMGCTGEDVKNAFGANYLAGLLILKLQDLKGLRLINDRSHSNLKSFSNSMSDINFWGRALFFPNATEVKQRMAKGEAEALYVEAGRVLYPRIESMMKVMSTSPGQINWSDTIASLVLLRHRYTINSSYFNNILYYLNSWETIDNNDKKKAISQSFMYLMQSDPKSALLSRMRELNSTTMLGKFINAATKVAGILGFKKITEDDATGTGAIATGDSSLGGNAIVNPPSSSQSSSGLTTDQFNKNVLGGLYRLKKLSPVQVTKKGKYVFKDSKIIKKRKKKFSPRRFKRPDPREGK